LLKSEGEKQAVINRAEGEKREMIAKSEGKAVEITKISVATAQGLMEIAKAIQSKGGTDAVSLRVAEQYIKEFGNLAKTNNSMIIPGNLSDLSTMVASATAIYKSGMKKDLIEELKNRQEKQRT